MTPRHILHEGLVHRAYATIVEPRGTFYKSDCAQYFDARDFGFNEYCVGFNFTKEPVTCFTCLAAEPPAR